MKLHFEKFRSPTRYGRYEVRVYRYKNQLGVLEVNSSGYWEPNHKLQTRLFAISPIYQAYAETARKAAVLVQNLEDLQQASEIGITFVHYPGVCPNKRHVMIDDLIIGSIHTTIFHNNDKFRYRPSWTLDADVRSFLDLPEQPCDMRLHECKDLVRIRFHQGNQTPIPEYRKNTLQKFLHSEMLKRIEVARSFEPEYEVKICS